MNVNIGEVRGDQYTAQTVIVKKSSKVRERANREQSYDGKGPQTFERDGALLPETPIAFCETQDVAESFNQAEQTIPSDLPVPVPVSCQDNGINYTGEEQRIRTSESRMESDGFVNVQVETLPDRNSSPLAGDGSDVDHQIYMDDLKHHGFECLPPDNLPNQDEGRNSEQTSVSSLAETSFRTQVCLQNSQATLEVDGPVLTEFIPSQSKLPAEQTESKNRELYSMDGGRSLGDNPRNSPEENGTKSTPNNFLPTEAQPEVTETKTFYLAGSSASNADSLGTPSLSLPSLSSLSTQSQNILVIKRGPFLLQDSAEPEVFIASLKTNDEYLTESQERGSFSNGGQHLLKVCWKGLRALEQTWWCLKLESGLEPDSIQELVKHVCTVLQENQADTLQSVLKRLLNRRIYLQKLAWDDGLVFILGHVNQLHCAACLQEQAIAEIKEILLNMFPPEMAACVTAETKMLDDDEDETDNAETERNSQSAHSGQDLQCTQCPDVFGQFGASHNLPLHHSYSQPSSVETRTSDYSWQSSVQELTQRLFSSLLLDAKIQEIERKQESENGTIHRLIQIAETLQKEVIQLKQSEQQRQSEMLRQELQVYVETKLKEGCREATGLVQQQQTDLKEIAKEHTEMLQWRYEFEGREQRALESAVAQMQEMDEQHREMAAQTEKNIETQILQLQAELLTQISEGDKNLENLKREIQKKMSDQHRSEERRHQGLLMQLIQMKREFDERLKAVEQTVVTHWSLPKEEVEDVLRGAEGGAASYAVALSETEKTTKFKAKEEEIAFNQYDSLRLEARQLGMFPGESAAGYPQTPSPSLPAAPSFGQSKERPQGEEVAQKTQNKTLSQKSTDKDISGSVSDVSDRESETASPPADKKMEDKDMLRAEQFLDWLSISGSLRSQQGLLKTLTQSVHEALKEESDPPSRAKCLDTILCLDVSASVVENPGLTKVKQIAQKFVDGVEDLMEEMDLEENIGVVTMGQRAKVIQHLTNDFTLVREAIESIDAEAGGRSPFIQALLVCLAANKGRGGVVNVAGVYKVRPRIIFITDGHPTDESIESGSDSPSNLSQVKFSLVQLITEISSKKHKSIPKPIFWVPVGNKANTAFLDSLAELCGGKSVPPDDITSLCRYYKIEQTIGRVYKMFKNHPEPYIDQTAKSMVSAISPNLTIDEKRMILEKVMKLKDEPPEEEEPEADSFDHVYEDKDKVKSGELLPLGTRVIRGPDWKWQNQDTDGPGTVIQHGTADNWIYIKWDNGTHNAYRYNQEGKKDIMESKHHPRELPLDNDNLDFGVRVVRGPDWKHGNQDGEGPGIIVRRRKDGKFKVRWENTGTIHEYYYSAKRGREVQIYTPQFARDNASLWTNDEKLSGKSVPESSKKNIPVWKWRDENRRWRLYSAEISEKLEREYQKRQQGSALITKNGKGWRVSFKMWQEKLVDEGIAHDVEREMVDEDGRNDLLAFELSLQIE